MRKAFKLINEIYSCVYRLSDLVKGNRGTIG